MRAFAKLPIGSFTRYSGTHSITGTVKELTVLAEKPVILLEDKSFFVVAATRSIGGSYTFTNLKPGKWLVLATDETAQYNAVVVDRVVTG
jgi:hypothetical protein